MSDFHSLLDQVAEAHLAFCVPEIPSLVLLMCETVKLAVQYTQKGDPSTSDCPRYSTETLPRGHGVASQEKVCSETENSHSTEDGCPICFLAPNSEVIKLRSHCAAVHVSELSRTQQNHPSSPSVGEEERRAGGED